MKQYIQFYYRGLGVREPQVDLNPKPYALNLKPPKPSTLNPKLKPSFTPKPYTYSPETLKKTPYAGLPP